MVLRRRARDGQFYTEEQFHWHYGLNGVTMWQEAASRTIFSLAPADVRSAPEPGASTPSDPAPPHEPCCGGAAELAEPRPPTPASSSAAAVLRRPPPARDSESDEPPEMFEVPIPDELDDIMKKRNTYGT